MKPLILLVEDDEDDHDLTRVYFRDAGFTPDIEWARNGLEALDYLRRSAEGGARRPDLVLADIKMPKMNGFELLERARADGRLAGVPFVFLTSSGVERDQREAERLGAAMYLQKPAGFEGYTDLIKKLKEFIQ